MILIEFTQNIKNELKTLYACGTLILLFSFEFLYFGMNCATYTCSEWTHKIIYRLDWTLDSSDIL